MKVWPQTQIETEACSHQVGLIYPPHVADWANNPSAGLNWRVIYNLEDINLTLNGFFFHIYRCEAEFTEMEVNQTMVRSQITFKFVFFSMFSRQNNRKHPLKDFKCVNNSWQTLQKTVRWQSRPPLPTLLPLTSRLSHCPRWKSQRGNLQYFVGAKVLLWLILPALWLF